MMQERASSRKPLPEVDQYLLLNVFKGPEKRYPQNILVHELFEKQAKKTPNSIAVEYQDQQMRPLKNLILQLIN